MKFEGTIEELLLLAGKAAREPVDGAGKTSWDNYQQGYTEGLANKLPYIPGYEYLDCPKWEKIDNHYTLEEGMTMIIITDRPNGDKTLISRDSGENVNYYEDKEYYLFRKEET